MVNVTTSPIATSLRLDGVAEGKARGTETLLTGGGLNDENSLENPTRITPETKAVKLRVPDSIHTFPPISLTVLRVRAKE